MKSIQVMTLDLLNKLRILIFFCLLFSSPSLSIAGNFVTNNMLFSYQPSYPNGTPPYNYNYAPSVIFNGSVQQFWWCGGANPTDVIYYTSYDFNTMKWSDIIKVLWPAHTSQNPIPWDNMLTCDPSVVMGSFPYNGINYSYAMYYSGTDDMRGFTGVGVAFSNDGINWVKYPEPLIRKPNPGDGTIFYGYGEQAVISANGGSNLWLWILNEPSSTIPQVYNLYESQTGTDLQLQYQITGNGVWGWIDGYGECVGGEYVQDFGLCNGFITEADFAVGYPSGTTPVIYMITDHVNNTSQMDLYQIDWDLQSSGTWSYLGSITSKLTGNAFNSSGGFLKNIYGDVSPWLPIIEVYFGSGLNRNNDNLWWAQY